ncbi:Pyrimidine 5'-nucleotidase [Rubrivivax sp. A210]|uniref:HAD-IA family hydrolase n=1 Tax=Rubrivivax sp. A210 TaxID=2772301 RepID=UPI001919FBAD|nr:HAD-IA family hydrolase [Rubrivivax sp. A210]CAD5372550.1 Pyrimidine 5'-nucleotidase [Rubrivivax sp. A210]
MLPTRVWLFDLDDTLHDASTAAYAGINEGMNSFMQRELGLSRAEASALRAKYWQRYGATLLGLVRHHGVDAAHFLHHAHLLPGLEERVYGHRHDLAALAALPGRRVLLTNAPAAYTARVLGVLGIAHLFERILSIEDLRMFGHWRPKPDARMLRALAVGLGVAPSRCTLVEDTLVHQKAARSIGMQTVWMQRWLRAGGRARRLARRPAYVDQRITRLRQLR